MNSICHNNNCHIHKSSSDLRVLLHPLCSFLIFSPGKASIVSLLALSGHITFLLSRKSLRFANTKHFFTYKGDDSYTIIIWIKSDSILIREIFLCFIYPYGVYRAKSLTDLHNMKTMNIVLCTGESIIVRIVIWKDSNRKHNWSCVFCCREKYIREASFRNPDSVIPIFEEQPTGKDSFHPAIRQFLGGMSTKKKTGYQHNDKHLSK